MTVIGAVVLIYVMDFDMSGLVGKRTRKMTGPDNAKQRMESLQGNKHERWTDEGVLDIGQPCLEHVYLVERGMTFTLPFSIHVPWDLKKIKSFMVKSNPYESMGFEVYIEDWQVHTQSEDEWSIDPEDGTYIKDEDVKERSLAATIKVSITTPLKKPELKQYNQIELVGDSGVKIVLVIHSSESEPEHYRVVGPDDRPECFE